MNLAHHKLLNFSRVNINKMNPNPPEMIYSSGRPLTSRTRKKLEQMDEDENLALVLALEEDEKIAQK